jgi:hypothetical protein
MIHAACLKSSSALPPIRMSMPAGLWRPDIRVCETPTTARRQGQLGPELVAVDDEGDHFVVERLKLPLRKTPTQLSKSRSSQFEVLTPQNWGMFLAGRGPARVQASI